jgi:hypothetical protein
LTASRRARKAPSSRVLCRSALCLYTHLMTPLTPRLEVKQSGYYIHYSTSLPVNILLRERVSTEKND